MGAGGHELAYSEARKAQAIRSRDEFIDQLTEEITTRFPQQSHNLVNTFSILSLWGVPFMTTEDLSNYGNDELLKLLDHYGSNKTKNIGGKVTVIPSAVDPRRTKMEWSLFKNVVKAQHYPTDKLSTLLGCIVKFHSATFLNLLKLVQLALILPQQTADTECGFSAQNLTKTAHKN